MINLTKKDIIIPLNPARLIVIVGPCRAGTTALANVFSKAGLTVYMQPIKSARRAREFNQEVTPWKIKEEDIAVVKETLGAKTEAEFFDPIKILLNLGYPKEKLVLIPIVRDPRKTLASWREMWGDFDVSEFVQSYELILKIKNQAQTFGIKTIPSIHEAIRDNPPGVVIKKLFEKIGIQKSISKDMLDWTSGPKFGQENPKTSYLKFYDTPPDKFVKEVKNWGEYKYREESYLKLSPEDKSFLQQNKVAEEIYEEFRQDCQRSLNLKIKSFDSVNYWC